jgi:hypothetical protein
MNSKKNRKHERPTPVAKQPAKGAPWPLIAVVIVAIAAGAGIVASRSSDDDPTATLTASSAPATATDPSPSADPGTGASETSATPFTPEGPNDLPMPPLPYASQMSGPAEQVRAAYVFAAQNPGLLEYVPCYCGCELDGHVSNVDCFVESRTPDGAVRAWDSHGMT